MKLHLPLPLRTAFGILVLAVPSAPAAEYKLKQPTDFPEYIDTDVSDTYILKDDIVFEVSPHIIRAEADITLTSRRDSPYDLSFTNTTECIGTDSAIQLDGASLHILNNKNISFANNRIASGGSAINLQNKSEQTISGNGDIIISGNSSHSGGTSYLNNSTQKISSNRNIAISNNTSLFGPGGVFCLQNNAYQIINNNGYVTFRNNTGYIGTCLYLENSVQTIQGNASVSFSGNMGYTGGGFYIEDNSTQTITGNGDIEFKNNTTAFTSAIHVTSQSAQTINNNGRLIFSDNMSHTQGSTISIINSTQAVNSNGEITFTNNTGSEGGAIMLSQATQTISGNQNIVFSDNHGYTNGGAISLNNHSVQTIQGNGDIQFINNTSGNFTGAIDLQNSSLDISDNGNIVFRGNGTRKLPLNHTVPTDHLYHLAAISGKATLLPGTQPSTSLVLSSSVGKTIIFHDPIVLAVADASGPANTDATLLHLNGKTSVDGTSQAAGDGNIILTGATTEEDLRAVLERTDSPMPDAATWATLVESSRKTVIDGAAVLHAGTFTIRDRAAYQGISFTSMSGSELHLSNAASMSLSKTAVFSPGSRITVSGTTPSSLTADTVMAGNVEFRFQLTTNAVDTRPLRFVNAPAALTFTSASAPASLHGSTFVVAPDSGVTLLKDGSYILLSLNQPAAAAFDEATEEYSYRIEGMTADSSTFTWQNNGTELIWTARGITLLQPPPPALPEEAHLTGAVVCNTLWSTAHSLQDFTDTMRTHSVQLTFGNTQRGAFWFDAIGSFRTQRGEGSLPGYDFHSWGAALGSEYTVAPHLIVGGGIGSLFGTNKADGGFSSINQDMVMGGAYANIRLMEQKNDSLWLNASATYGNSRNDGHISARNGSNRLDGAWNEKAWTSDLRAVWSHALGEHTRLLTFAGIRYTTAKQNAFHAAGEQTGTYSFKEASLSSVQLPVGVGITHEIAAWSFYGDVSILPDANRSNPLAAIESAQGHRYTSGGVNPGRCSFEVTAAAAYTLNEKWRLTAGYQLETTGDNTQQSVNLGTVYTF